MTDLENDLSSISDEVDVPEEEQPKKEPAKDDAKKSMTIEYHHYDRDEE
jgi:hypothetical protein